MKIMKFGGASLGSAEKIIHVASLIDAYAKTDCVVTVVSAMAGVTDRLIEVFNFYKAGKTNIARELLYKLYRHHRDAMDDIVQDFSLYHSLEIALQNLFTELFNYTDFKANGVYDRFASFGERFSSLLITTAIQQRGFQARMIDSAGVIVTNEEYGKAQPLLAQTVKKARSVIIPLCEKGILPVVTGFYGATENGKVAILGRGGSDYSATILAYALSANEVILWKEVDGIYSGDPLNDKDANFIAELTYTQASELAKNGAKILHPEAMKPVAESAIPVLVKNTFFPDRPGSRIWKGAAG